MNPHFTLFGLTIFWYGLILGCAIALVLILIDNRAAHFDRRQQKAIKKGEDAPPAHLQYFFQQWSVFILVGGFVGARLWHVATDWQLYNWNLLEIITLSHGGLSILGAMVGGTVAILLARILSGWRKSPSSFLILDTIAVALPFGQVVGRLGNWVNQELYGLPTNLPWAITIDVAHRLPGFEALSSYHPLFLYESLFLAVFGCAVWYVLSKKQHMLGTGFVVTLYVFVYTGFRFWLDFLRIDRPVWIYGLSSNQMLLGVSCILAAAALIHRHSSTSAIQSVIKKTLTFSALALIVYVAILSFWQVVGKPPTTDLDTLRSSTDRSIVTLLIGGQPLRAEVVNSPASITRGLSGRSQIGTDAMLFVLPKREIAVFWMKEMQFDLDLVWIDDGAIVKISENVPAPDRSLPNVDLPKYSSTVPVTHVIEVPAGVAQQRKWQVGQFISIQH
ncbi:prolipoprotein diacylglyceryl transferase [Candidatus Woesebacteria bacterium]|nr:prolipoprotein diacylglyceryl transferase [Candidatus Woesebacteria bacterium]